MKVFRILTRTKPRWAHNVHCAEIWKESGPKAFMLGLPGKGVFPAWAEQPQTHYSPLTTLGNCGGAAGDRRYLLEISRWSPTFFQLPLPTDKEERVGNVSLVIWILPKGLKNDSGCRYPRLGMERTRYKGLDLLIHCSFQICYSPVVVYPGYWFGKSVTVKGLRQSPGVPHMGRAQWCP